MTDAMPNAPPTGTLPRSKAELLYHELLRESHQLISRIEDVTQRQEEIQQALQALPTAIRQAGLDAANQAAGQANRSLLEATRTLAQSASQLRIATRTARSAMPAVAWRAGLLCSMGALCGSALGASLFMLLMHF
ncbi:hypothetical protein [Bordetella petrii]|uniref:hypothetical protein n=1 Tax=Bordetella petrii TaxID=94624 RepID=UPI000576D0C8|nr:hypothetical protein [Bordetella petrii]